MITDLKGKLLSLAKKRKLKDEEIKFLLETIKDPWEEARGVLKKKRKPYLLGNIKKRFVQNGKIIKFQNMLSEKNSVFHASNSKDSESLSERSKVPVLSHPCC